MLSPVGPLAQSVERRADNAKVVSSRLTWTIFFFHFGKGYIILFFFFYYSFMDDIFF